MRAIGLAVDLDIGGPSTCILWPTRFFYSIGLKRHYYLKPCQTAFWKRFFSWLLSQLCQYSLGSQCHQGRYGHHGRDGHQGRDGHHGCLGRHGQQVTKVIIVKMVIRVPLHIMVVMVVIVRIIIVVMDVLVVMVIMVIGTGQTDLTFKLEFPGNLWRAAFAILAMFLRNFREKMWIVFYL